MTQSLFTFEPGFERIWGRSAAHGAGDARAAMARRLAGALVSDHAS